MISIRFTSHMFIFQFNLHASTFFSLAVFVWRQSLDSSCMIRLWRNWQCQEFNHIFQVSWSHYISTLQWATEETIAASLTLYQKKKKKGLHLCKI